MLCTRESPMKLMDRLNNRSHEVVLLMHVWTLVIAACQVQQKSQSIFPRFSMKICAQELEVELRFVRLMKQIIQNVKFVSLVFV